MKMVPKKWRKIRFIQSSNIYSRNSFPWILIYVQYKNFYYKIDNKLTPYQRFGNHENKC